MTRPTKEDVDEAFDKLETKLLAGMGTFVEDVLCREVIALREESDELRDIIAALQSAPLLIEANESHRLAVQPRYSTEAVDVLLEACDSAVDALLGACDSAAEARDSADTNKPGTDALRLGFGPVLDVLRLGFRPVLDVLDAVETARASRKPVT